MGLWGQVVDPRLAVEMGRRGGVPGAAMWMRPTESETGAQAGGADGAAVGLVGMEVRTEAQRVVRGGRLQSSSAWGKKSQPGVKVEGMIEVEVVEVLEIVEVMEVKVMEMVKVVCECMCVFTHACTRALCPCTHALEMPGSVLVL